VDHPEGLRAGPALSRLVYAIPALFLTLAWPLRGQFGHGQGALIPGAFAAAAVAGVIADPRWRSAYGRSMLLGAAGFSAGGTLAYGQPIADVLAAPTLAQALHPMATVAAIGAVWGGLGMTFLGLGLSERPLRARDLAVALVFGAVCGVVLGLWDRDDLGLALLAAGLIALQAANAVVTKSAVVRRFGVMGTAGFGAGFAAAVLLLWAGTHGWLGSGRWWNLRDQWVGAIGGLTIAWAARASLARGLHPAPASWFLQAAGSWCQVAAVPLINALDVYTYWSTQQQAVFGPELLRAIAFGGSAAFAALGLGWAVALGRLRADRLAVIRWGTLIGLWLLVALGIGKEVIPLGWKRWELTYTLFVVETVALSGWLLLGLRPTRDA
jgi:hypothetical protein